MKYCVLAGKKYTKSGIRSTASVFDFEMPSERIVLVITILVPFTVYIDFETTPDQIVLVISI